MSAHLPLQQRFFVNAYVDAALIGALSVLTFVGLSLFHDGQRSPAVIQTGIWLMWIINWPHFSMSTYRLYQARSHLQQYPFTAYVIPWIVSGGALLSFLHPDQFAPYFVKLFLLWSPYHFSGQTIGITLVYARRCGIELRAWEQKSLRYFVYGTFLLSTIRSEVSREGAAYFGINYPSFGIPSWLADFTESAFWLSAAFFAFSTFSWRLRNHRWLPAIVLLPSVTQYLWFVQAMYMPAFQEFVPMFHSLQYVFIAWALQMKTALDTRNATPSRKFVVGETLRWGSVNLLGGVGLFYALPALGEAAGSPRMLAEGILVAAVQIHHFFVDGVIWKLRNPKVAQPLLMHIRDVTGAEDKAQQAYAT